MQWFFLLGQGILTHLSRGLPAMWLFGGLDCHSSSFWSKYQSYRWDMFWSKYQSYRIFKLSIRVQVVGHSSSITQNINGLHKKFYTHIPHVIYLLLKLNRLVPYWGNLIQQIIGLDKLLDNSSVESMNEEHTIGDSLDEAEQEELNHEIALESTEDCTGSLCKATAFLFPKTAFDFLTNVAASLFGIHGSPSPSSVLVDPRYEIVKMAEMQPCAEETPKEEQIVKFVAQIDKPILSSEDAVSKRFDVVTDCLDHHFVKENGHESVTRGWLKKVRLEWNILQNDLPDGIHVRVYEERMDLLRACIVGAPGTPYHDNLFFFDIFFPPDYPHEPPVSSSIPVSIVLVDKITCLETDLIAYQPRHLVEKLAFGRKLGGGPKKKAVSRSVKAGLQFPVGRIRRYLKE
ncbi:hypothetical protein ACJX0J_041181, partial [Zea mays]